MRALREGKNVSTGLGGDEFALVLVGWVVLSLGSGAGWGSGWGANDPTVTGSTVAPSSWV